MLDSLFPERGWYRYIDQVVANQQGIIGPYPTRESAYGLPAPYFVFVQAKYHWNRPEGSISRIGFDMEESAK